MMYFVVPKCNQIQIDIDRPHARLPKARLKQIQAWTDIRVTKVVRTESSSGNTHFHLTINKQLPVAERLLMAALLGDDYVRTILSWGRHRRRTRHPILLFEKEMIP